MSRTNKDKPSRVNPLKARARLQPHERELARRTEDVDWQWLDACPKWFRRMFMNRPERREAHLLEKDIVRQEDIEDVDFPDLRKKPKIYYY